jgi:hypothetical protein
MIDRTIELVVIQYVEICLNLSQTYTECAEKMADK